MNYRLTELKVLLFLLLLSAVSCQRPMYDEEDDEDGVSQTNLPLKISARSSGESQINYPAYIYAFAEDGSCSASLKMTDNACPIYYCCNSRFGRRIYRSERS